MRLAVITCAALILAGCGADGEPIQPKASTNVTLSSKGIGARTNVRLGKGPFAVNLGLGL